MTLKERAEEIAQTLNKKYTELLESREHYAAEKQVCYEEYRVANTGDSSENAPLEAAIKHLKEVNASMMNIEKQLTQFASIEDLSRYNSVGIVVLYSTVRLELDMDGSKREYIYRIYPNGVSFVQDGIIAADSRLATALMGKTVGSTVEVEHTSRKQILTYIIKEIY